MKKIIITTIILGYIFNTAGYAISERGSYPSLLLPNVIFASAEGSYNWINARSFSFNGHTVSQTPQPWGGRAAGGLLYYATEHFGMGIEAGWGYYGGVKDNSSIDLWRAKSTLEGYDLLFDTLYNIERFDLFADVGFLLQSQRLHFSSNRDFGNLSALLRAELLGLFDQTQMLPELKLGGIYHLNNYLGISLHYLLVVGSSAQNNSDSSGSVSTLDAGNPTLNTIMLGLRYSFAL